MNPGHPNSSVTISGRYLNGKKLPYSKRGTQLVIDGRIIETKDEFLALGGNMGYMESMGWKWVWDKKNEHGKWVNIKTAASVGAGGSADGL